MIKKLKWIVHRAAAMPLGEYVYRFSYLFFSVATFFKKTLKLELKCKFRKPNDEALSDSVFKDILTKDFPELLPAQYKLQCIEEADQIIKNKFTFFEFVNEYLGSQINWNFDYKNKSHFSLRYALFNSRSFRKQGDIKYVLEINKHQELVRLAEAYVLTKDARYVEKVKEIILDWINQCPYLCGVNWSSPTVMAYRLISWTITFELLRSHYSFSNGFLEKWATSVFQHIYILRKKYSKFSSAGNHLISEATGVFIAALRWNEFFKDSSRTLLHSAQAEALALLTEEVEKQIHTDGVNHEQAMSYHIFAASQFFLALYFGKKTDIKFPKIYSERLHGCATFLYSVLNNRALPPMFGDEDSAWPYRFCGTNSNKCLEQLSTFSIFLNDNTLNPYSFLSETAYWLFGSNIIDSCYPSEGKESENGLINSNITEQMFPEGGYYVASLNKGNEKEILVLFDHGPLGAESTGAHGHADALSVWLSIAGDWIFTDSGTYHYKNSVERKALRGTSAHNTLNFGDQSNQDKYLGPFLWGERHKACGEYIEQGAFKGKVQWYSGESHSRRLEIFDHKLLINDSWKGNEPPQITFILPFEIAPLATIDEQNIVYIDSESFSVYLKATGCLVKIEDVKVSPTFYKLVDSKKIVIYPGKCIGEQEIQIGWEFK